MCQWLEARADITQDAFQVPHSSAPAVSVSRVKKLKCGSLLACGWSTRESKHKSHFELRYRIHVSFFCQSSTHSLESPFEALECGSATFGEVFFHRERV